MQDLDEVIGPALLGLRELEPRITPASLIQLDKRRARARKHWEMAASVASAAALIGTVALSMQPKSAIASLRESVGISNAQSAIHIHSETNDMWIFPDHYIRQAGHFLHMSTLRGTSFNLDDRLQFGFRTQNAKWESEFLKKRMTGRIDEALERARQDPRGTIEVIRAVKAHGGVYDDYRITTPGCYQGVLTVDLYVDPATRLMRFEDQKNVSPYAEPNVSSSAIEYPNAEQASRQAPVFRARTPFLTEDEIRQRFLACLKAPEQSRVVGGIRVSLFGVLLRHTANEKAFTADVITQGGAGSDILQDHWVEIQKGPLSSEERLIRSLGFGHSHIIAPGEFFAAQGAHVCGPLKLGGAKFVVNPANQTLATFPEQLTLRVPVWRSDTSVSLRSTRSSTASRAFHPSRLVGYATFTTRRIVSDGGDMELDLFGVFPSTKAPTYKMANLRDHSGP